MGEGSTPRRETIKGSNKSGENSSSGHKQEVDTDGSSNDPRKDGEVRESSSDHKWDEVLCVMLELLPAAVRCLGQVRAITKGGAIRPQTSSDHKHEQDGGESSSDHSKKRRTVE